jgi:hypothetical protein
VFPVDMAALHRKRGTRLGEFRDERLKKRPHRPGTLERPSLNEQHRIGRIVGQHAIDIMLGKRSQVPIQNFARRFSLNNLLSPFTDICSFGEKPFEKRSTDAERAVPALLKLRQARTTTDRTDCDSALQRAYSTG